MLEKTEKRHRIKKETFLQGVLVLMVSQVLIKILGLVQTLYLTPINDPEPRRWMF